MVLKGKDRGVTLIELLIAISLSSVVVGLALALFKDAGLAARLGQSRRDAVFQARTLFGSLAGNLMTGDGILRLAPGRVDILSARRRRMDFAWEDSTLTVNGSPRNFRLSSMTVEAEGPTRPEWNGFSGEPDWDLDSLDGNRDGTIGFEELDRDGNGELEPEECRFIARLRVSMTTVNRGTPFTQTCVVHPRNRVPAAAGDDAESVLESEGIPDP